MQWFATVRRVLTPIVLVALVSSCATPVSVKRIDPKTVQRSLTRNVLSSGKLSEPTRSILYQRDLVTRFEKDPAGALAILHGFVVSGQDRPGDLYGLAELSFYHAEHGGKSPYYWAAAIYAYLYLFPNDPSAAPNRYDPRLRTACDIYNRGITGGLATEDGAYVRARAGTFALPFGTLDLQFDANDLVWDHRRLVDFVPVAELDVRGLDTRYRWPGIGAPLAASLEPVDENMDFHDFLAPWAKTLRTALVRFDDAQEQLAGGQLQARLELKAPGEAQTVQIEGRDVPLEVETSAALALMLAESPLWQQEIAGFIRGFGVIGEKSRLVALTPYRPGRIPLVLVHGTASSAGRWAQLVNELINDRVVRENYQVWLFSYSTGNPIAYSSLLLREALTTAVEDLDPEGKDPALREMVVVGHSQGGLLTKMTAIESGDVFWNSIANVKFTDVVLTQATRELLQKALFVHPLPFVRRVVFIATPQRGSFFAGSRLAHLGARLITLPLDLTHLSADLLLRNQKTLAFARMAKMPTAVDNMTPGNPFIKALASIPVVPGVHAHSIIAVKGDGPYEDGNDGIVEYESAHIDGVDSELVVRSGHSCQANPNTLAEVRRILLLHLKED
jgi:pimeloyl-ACP methyl ester carboxylesterase